MEDEDLYSLDELQTMADLGDTDAMLDLGVTVGFFKVCVAESSLKWIGLEVHNMPKEREEQAVTADHVLEFPELDIAPHASAHIETFQWVVSYWLAVWHLCLQFLQSVRIHVARFEMRRYVLDTLLGSHSGRSKR